MSYEGSPWQQAKALMGAHDLRPGQQFSAQYLSKPEHLAMVLARYRTAAHLIGKAETVLEVGCGEGIGAGILASGRRSYLGIDPDGDAISTASGIYTDWMNVGFTQVDATLPMVLGAREAVVSLDVIEHIDPDAESSFMKNIALHLFPRRGVCVIGTPNASAAHLASPESRAGHINLYSHARLESLMQDYFSTVLSFGMQDTGLHLGHPEMRHYLLFVGVGPL